MISGSLLQQSPGAHSAEFHLLLSLGDGVAQLLGRIAGLSEMEEARLLSAIDALFADHGISAATVILNGKEKSVLPRKEI